MASKETLHLEECHLDFDYIHGECTGMSGCICKCECDVYTCVSVPCAHVSLSVCVHLCHSLYFSLNEYIWTRKGVTKLIFPETPLKKHLYLRNGL